MDNAGPIVDSFPAEKGHRDTGARCGIGDTVLSDEILPLLAIGVGFDDDADRSQIGKADGSIRLATGTPERWHSERNKNSENSDGAQKLKKREPAVA